MTILNRLNEAGYQAYLVGGSVRDLLIQKSPKDFDVATNATPQQIKKLFRNARIIGRRFKLIHVLYHREVIEVATFRSFKPVNTNLHVTDQGMLLQDNAYGTMEQDAWRRDFSINALYYDVRDQVIVDFTGGMADLLQQSIRIIGDARTRYHEDPVRMLRAIRFSAKLQFSIAKASAEPIAELAYLIGHVSSSRLFDEMLKLYQCGQSLAVQNLLEQHGLFQHLFPVIPTPSHPNNAFLRFALESTDYRIKNSKPVNPAFIFAVLLWDPVAWRAKELCDAGIDPLVAFEQAMSQIISEQNRVVLIPKRHTQVMREIWLLQSRFAKRTRAEQLLAHPRFRAAYDFLALRALVDDALLDLAKWWTTYQEVDSATKAQMVAACSHQVLARHSE